MRLEITDGNKEFIRELHINSIKSGIKRELRFHPHRVELLCHLESYMNKTPDVYDIMRLKTQILHLSGTTDEIVEKIKNLEPYLVIKERIESFTAYHHEGVVETTMQYCRIRLYDSYISIDKAILDKLDDYLCRLVKDELFKVQSEFFRCTEDEELYNLVISKLGL